MVSQKESEMNKIVWYLFDLDVDKKLCTKDLMKSKE